MIAATLALAAGCGGSSSSSGAKSTDSMDSAFSSALSGIDQVACTTALADLARVEVRFIQGGDRSATVASARKALGLAHEEAGDQSCTAGQRQKIARVAKRISCDIKASASGRYCPP